MNPTGFIVSSEKAEEFYMNTNQLKFIRKNILFNNRSLFKMYQDEYLEEANSLQEDSPSYLPIPDYKPETQDL